MPGCHQERVFVQCRSWGASQAIKTALHSPAGRSWVTSLPLPSSSPEKTPPTVPPPSPRAGSSHSKGSGTPVPSHCPNSLQKMREVWSALPRPPGTLGWATCSSSLPSMAPGMWHGGPPGVTLARAQPVPFHWLFNTDWGLQLRLCRNWRGGAGRGDQTPCFSSWKSPPLGG